MDQLDARHSDMLSFDVVTDEAGSVTVTLRGELDMSSAQELDAAVSPTIQTLTGRLILDVDELTFADSSAIALWVRWATITDQVEIHNASELLRAVIQRMGLDQQLQLTP